MKQQSSRESAENADSRWPAAPIWAYGTFGRATPAGRRYHLRSGVALAALVICFVSGVFLRSFPDVLKVITAFAPGAVFIYIAWEFRRYLLALDELARRIQLESIAWTYLCGLAGAMLLGGIGLVYDWRFNPIWLIVLEPVRAAWLFFVSRRYQ